MDNLLKFIIFKIYILHNIISLAHIHFSEYFGDILCKGPYL